MNKWDKRFMDQAISISNWSKDTNKKTGAIIVDADRTIISTGYNGQPRGCDDSVESRFESPEKYLYTEHSERNAIFHAAKHGIPLKGCTIYATYFPCADCARAIIQSGITKVFAPTPDVTHHKWGEHFKASLVMLKEANIELNFID